MANPVVVFPQTKILGIRNFSSKDRSRQFYVLEFNNLDSGRGEVFLKDEVEAESLRSYVNTLVDLTLSVGFNREGRAVVHTPVLKSAR